MCEVGCGMCDVGCGMCDFGCWNEYLNARQSQLGGTTKQEHHRS